MSKNRHSVKAESIDGDLSCVEWKHRGEGGKLVRVREGWILTLGKTCYQLTMSGTAETAVFKDDTGEYMATKVEPDGGFYSTEENAVVILEGTGKLLLDSEVLETNDTHITKDGVKYTEGDVITVAGRRARIAIGQSI